MNISIAQFDEKWTGSCLKGFDGQWNGSCLKRLDEKWNENCIKRLHELLSHSEITKRAYELLFVSNIF